MIPEFPNSSRELQQRLDRAVPPGTRDLPLAPDDDPLVEAARRLAQAPEVSLSGAALDRIEARLMAALAEPPRRATARSHQMSAHRIRWLAYAAAACLALVMLLTGATYASADSLPGDPLYGFKRAVERVRLALVEQTDEPALRLELAERRAGEFAALLERQDVYPRALEEASDELQRALNLSLSLDDAYAPDALQDRIATLAQEQESLSVRAQAIAAGQERAQLATIAQRSRAIQQRAAGADTPPDTPGAPPITVPAASMTPPPTNTPRPTRTPRPTATALPARVPGPTRTPPGFGPTPGLGDNPPGQGGDHPGVGNDGQPPGQSKTDPSG